MVLIIEIIQRGIIINVNSFSCNVSFIQLNGGRVLPYGQTGMRTLIVAFLNFASAARNENKGIGKVAVSFTYGFTN
jgi:endonuclease I